MDIPSQVKVARATADWLRQELSSLTPEQWELPGACGVWSVAEEVAHLVWVSELYADGIRRGLLGDISPSAGNDLSPVYAERAEQIAKIASDRRQALASRLFDQFVESSQALIDIFERLGPGDWRVAAYHVSGVKSPELLLALSIVETSVHGWDILYRIGREVALPDGCHEPIIDWLPIRLRGSFRPGDRLSEPFRFLFVLTSPLLRLIYLRINGDSFDIDPPLDESGSDAVFTLHPDAYILLFMDRVRWHEALDSGAVAVTGRQDLARDLPSWFGLS